MNEPNPSTEAIFRAGRYRQAAKVITEAADLLTRAVNDPSMFKPFVQDAGHRYAAAVVLLGLGVPEEEADRNLRIETEESDDLNKSFASVWPCKEHDPKTRIWGRTVRLNTGSESIIELGHNTDDGHSWRTSMSADHALAVGLALNRIAQGAHAWQAAFNRSTEGPMP